MAKLCVWFVVTLTLSMLCTSVYAVPIEFNLSTELEYYYPDDAFVGTDAVFSLTYTIDSNAVPDLEESLSISGGRNAYQIHYFDFPATLTITGSLGSITSSNLNDLSFSNLPDPMLDRMDSRYVPGTGFDAFLSISLPTDFWTGDIFPRPAEWSSTNWNISIFNPQGNIAYIQGGGSVSITATSTAVNPIPEPATMLLLGSGLVGLASLGRRKFFKE